MNGKSGQLAIKILIVLLALPVLIVAGALFSVWLIVMVAVSDNWDNANVEREISDIYERTERIGGVQLPQGASLVYDMNCFVSINGDGSEYAVICYDQDVDLTALQFSALPNEQVEHAFDSNIEGLESQLKLSAPQNCLPDWQAEYLWLTAQPESNVIAYFAYFPQSLNMYTLLIIS